LAAHIARKGAGKRWFLGFAHGSAGDWGSLFPIFCLIDLTSLITRIKNIKRRANIRRSGAVASDVYRGGLPQSRLGLDWSKLQGPEGRV
jgi:hypothetical protein